MRTSIVIGVFAAFASCAAAPTASNPWKRANMTDPSDLEVLQYALTLENLEAAFYQEGLNKYSAEDFEQAGFPDWVRGRVSEVATHEQTHVNLLSAALGNDSVAPCQYSFPYSNVKEFLILACGLENIGVSAYAGANKYISDDTYSTIAATILSVEARHQAFFYAPVLKQAPWTGPFDTPLDLNMVYTLASQLITSCPDSNVTLPVMAYPTLTVTSPPASSMVASSAPPIFNGMPGATIPLNYEGSDSGSAQYAAIYNGLGATTVPIKDGAFTVPEGIQGYSYVLVTSSSDIAGVTSDNIIAGPAEMQTSFNSQQPNPGFMNPYGA